MLLEGLALALAAADPVDLQVREGEEWLPTQLTVLPVRPVVCVMHPPANIHNRDSVADPDPSRIRINNTILERTTTWRQKTGTKSLKKAEKNLKSLT